MIDAVSSADWSRVYIFGNSGSGKSWLAHTLAKRLGWPIVHLDALRWDQIAPSLARDNNVVALEVAKLATNSDRWIMKGVYGWLADIALPRATILICQRCPLSQLRALIATPLGVNFGQHYGLKLELENPPR